MLKYTGLRMEIDFLPCDVPVALAKELKIEQKRLLEWRIARKSLDARDKQDIHYVLTVEFTVAKEAGLLSKPHVSKATVYSYDYPAVWQKSSRPVVVGSGPAGLFAALILAYSGARPILLERGEAVEDRQRSVQQFFGAATLNTESNIQFGEGGAGTFSDGKLTTGTKDPRQHKVLQEFVEAGAPEEILYDAKPHIGTDLLPGVVRRLREKIISLGGEVRFSCRMDDLIMEEKRICGVQTSCGAIATEDVILAIGHSARDTFAMLHARGVLMEQKPFSVGVRIEHLQSDIGRAQYGAFARRLPPADYKTAIHMPDGRGVYTFCMCPGGTVVAAASEKETVVTNGMSPYRRDGVNANSALLVSVLPSDLQSDDVLAGIAFQRKLEKAAFYLGGGDYKAPIQTVRDFLAGEKSQSIGRVEPTYPIGVTLSNLRKLFPEAMGDALARAIRATDRRIAHFSDGEAILTGVESRSSSPVRIVRSASGEALPGLYPAGEGAGYAGGIMSAAVDGIRAAEWVLQKNVN